MICELIIIRLYFILFFVVLECVVCTEIGSQDPHCKENQAQLPQTWKALAQVCRQNKKWHLQLENNVVSYSKQSV